MKAERKKGRYFSHHLVALYVTVMLLGAAQLLTYRDGVFNFLLLVAYTWATLWVVRDSKDRGKPIVSIVQALILFSCTVSVPIYLIWSRKLWGVLWVLIHLVGLVIAMFLGIILAMSAVYGPSVFFQPQ